MNRVASRDRRNHNNCYELLIITIGGGVGLVANFVELFFSFSAGYSKLCKLRSCACLLTFQVRSNVVNHPPAIALDCGPTAEKSEATQTPCVIFGHYSFYCIVVSQPCHPRNAFPAG